MPLEGCTLPNSQTFRTNFPISKFGVDELQILTWTGRGIYLSDIFARKFAGVHVKRISYLAHILCFQEVHGKEGDVFHQLSAWLPGWKIFVSSSFNMDGTINGKARGVATAICPKLCSMAIYEPQYLVPGRCLVSSVSVGDKVLSVCVMFAILGSVLMMLWS